MYPNYHYFPPKNPDNYPKNQDSYPKNQDFYPIIQDFYPINQDSYPITEDLQVPLYHKTHPESKDFIKIIKISIQKILFLSISGHLIHGSAEPLVRWRG